MIQLVQASTLYGAATAVAAIQAGAMGSPDRRVLVMANTTFSPELAPTVAEMPGFAAVSGHFHQIVSYNEAIAPFHPSAWRPSVSDVTLLERHFRELWDLGDGPLELVLESIQVPPALTLANVFASSRITIYADGLMSYGPTRIALGQPIASRISEILHPDLVPGLRPALLREFNTPPHPIDLVVQRDVLDAMTATITQQEAPPTSADGGDVLVLGQFLTALGLLSEAEEQRLHQRMIGAAVAAGAARIVFKSHPSAPPTLDGALVEWAASQQFDLAILPANIPAESMFVTAPPKYVVGCFSTALLTAVSMYGLPAATVGTGELLARLRPYENSNRVPLTIAAALLPDLEEIPVPPTLPVLNAERVARDLQPLIDTVAYCMQPVINGDLHDQSAAWLASNAARRSAKYFDRRRLTSLGLPGGKYVPLWQRIPRRERLRIRRAVGQSRKVVRQAKHSVKKIVKP